MWLDRGGPFLEDDRLDEPDDLFMFSSLDVTNSGLGEAARRSKARQEAATFSIQGGEVSFEHSPLMVTHGLSEAPFGEVAVVNVCSIKSYIDVASSQIKISNWRDLITVASQRYRHLIIPESIAVNKLLAREPFSEVISRQTLTLFGYLDAYMAGRGPSGMDGPKSREIYEKFFVGENALFTSESESNKEGFRSLLTFPEPAGGGKIFAPWHGKIRHRFFRLHFEFPVPNGQSMLRILYLGPKITKS